MGLQPQKEPYNECIQQLPDENGNNKRKHEVAFGGGEEVTNLHEFHTFQLDERPHLSPGAAELFHQMLDASDFQRFTYIYQVMDMNPLCMDYNPNKSNAITSQQHDPDKFEKRRRNNIASRMSRHRKKTQCRLSQVNTEYLEGANEKLVQEINLMANMIRQRQIQLEQLLHSPEFVLRLRDECGLRAVRLG